MFLFTYRVQPKLQAENLVFLYNESKIRVHENPWWQSIPA